LDCPCPTPVKASKTAAASWCILNRTGVVSIAVGFYPRRPQVSLIVWTAPLCAGRFDLTIRYAR
jgi:hypothetical protein